MFPYEIPELLPEMKRLIHFSKLMGCNFSHAETYNPHVDHILVQNIINSAVGKVLAFMVWDKRLLELVEKQNDVTCIWRVKQLHPQFEQTK